METSGYIALSNQLALRQRMSVIAQNLANMNTSGYQGEDMLFVEHLTRTEDGKNLSFVQNLAMVRDLNPGPLSKTNNPFDLSIRGEGYFKVETELGERYTRAGNFTLNADGTLVTAAGDPVLSIASGEITVPPDAKEVAIASDGTISTETGELGRIGVFTFENEQNLLKTEAGLYDPGEEEARPDTKAAVEQGMLEGSNVQGVLEMTKLIEVQRKYQSTSRMIQDEHKRQRQMIEQLLGN